MKLPLGKSPFLLDSSALLQQDTFTNQGNGPQFSWKGKVHSLIKRGADLERSPCPRLVLDSKFSQFNWSKEHYPDWSEWTYSDWSGEDANEDIASLIGWEKSHSFWLKYNSRSSFISAGWDHRNTVQPGSSVQASA